jgi:hypothetical protein
MWVIGYADLAVFEWRTVERAGLSMHVGDCARNREAPIRDDGKQESAANSHPGSICALTCKRIRATNVGDRFGRERSISSQLLGRSDCSPSARSTVSGRVPFAITPRRLIPRRARHTRTSQILGQIIAGSPALGNLAAANYRPQNANELDEGGRLVRCRMRLTLTSPPSDC